MNKLAERQWRPKCHSCLGEPTGRIVHKGNGMAFPFCKHCVKNGWYNRAIFTYEDSENNRNETGTKQDQHPEKE